eukprot:48088-Pelagomonas_calceolata.AAC.1
MPLLISYGWMQVLVVRLFFCGYECASARNARERCHATHLMATTGFRTAAAWDIAYASLALSLATNAGCVLASLAAVPHSFVVCLAV